MNTRNKARPPSEYVPTMREAALWYAQHGLAAIPLKGKVPLIDNWQRARPQDAAHHPWPGGCNVGIVCGQVSGNLVILDTDDSEREREFVERSPHLLDTFTVKSRRGHHLYFRCDELPASLKIAGVDLLSTGKQAVAPPSIHPQTCQPYIVAHRAPILHVPNLHAVTDWMQSQRPAADKPAPRPASSSPVGSATRYGQKALTDELAAVAAATLGNRNAALFTAGLKLFSLVRAGALDRTSVENGLLDASQRNGYLQEHGQYAALKTISSAWDRAQARRRANG